MDKGHIWKGGHRGQSNNQAQMTQPRDMDTKESVGARLNSCGKRGASISHSLPPTPGWLGHTWVKRLFPGDLSAT